MFYSMLQINRLDLKKRDLFKKNEIKIKIYKSLLDSLDKKKNLLVLRSNKHDRFNEEFINSNLYFQLKFYLLKKIGNLKKNSFRTKISNRCIWTGRSKAILSKFRMSRITFKKYVSNREIPGYSKYSW